MKTVGIAAHSAEGSALCGYAVREAVDERPVAIEAGWLTISEGGAFSSRSIASRW